MLSAQSCVVYKGKDKVGYLAEILIQMGLVRMALIPKWIIGLD